MATYHSTGSLEALLLTLISIEAISVTAGSSATFLVPVSVTAGFLATFLVPAFFEAFIATAFLAAAFLAAAFLATAFFVAATLVVGFLVMVFLTGRMKRGGGREPVMERVVTAIARACAR